MSASAEVCRCYILGVADVCRIGVQHDPNAGYRREGKYNRTSRLATFKALSSYSVRRVSFQADVSGITYDSSDV